jgi:hypothetical protein
VSRTDADDPQTITAPDIDHRITVPFDAPVCDEAILTVVESPIRRLDCRGPIKLVDQLKPDPV